MDVLGTKYDQESAARWFASRRDAIAAMLTQLVSIDTSLGKESAALPFIEDYLRSAGFVTRREPFHRDLGVHWAHSPHSLSQIRTGGPNLRALYKRGGNPGRDITFNCHMDVVPCTEESNDLFSPKKLDGRVFGRGAADTKNNLVMLIESLRYISEHDLRLSRRVWLDLVAEEEVGGNGTLSTILHGLPSNEVVVLEPTSLGVYRGHRGCLTFRVLVTGRAVHMGSSQSGQSAIKAAMRVIEALEGLESEMLAEARSNVDFKIWDTPLQLNIGILHGGEWPGSVPERCEVIANLGFLPPQTLSDVENLLSTRCAQALTGVPNVTLAIDCNVGIRNSAYICAHDLPLVQELGAAVEGHGGAASSFGWKVSCDAHLYNTVAKVPVVIFGSGSLSEAHSDHESVELVEIERGASILAQFLTSTT